MLVRLLLDLKLLIQRTNHMMLTGRQTRHRFTANPGRKRSLFCSHTVTRTANFLWQTLNATC